jgi:repressor LexA
MENVGFMEVSPVNTDIDRTTPPSEGETGPGQPARPDHAAGGEGEFGGPSVGSLIRARRQALGLTLQQLAETCGCAKSYLSTIENEGRSGPPSDALLARLEVALTLTPNTLIRAAHWQNTPATVRRRVQLLEGAQRAAATQLRELLAAERPPGEAGPKPLLDELWKNGRLRKVIERLGGVIADPSPAPVAPGAARPERAKDSLLAALPVEVPLINSVAAGYPTEFTDLSYPARVADEYVRTPDIHDADAFAARVVGDSMTPDYREGDIVVFSPARTVKSGMDCFVRLEPDHETTFKRVFFHTDEGGQEWIRLQPLNSAYAPKSVTREMVAGLYAAVSVTRSVGG